MAYPNQIFSVFAFLSVLMCLIPLPWHLHAWNTGTCLFMIWTGTGSLILFINSIIWTGNINNWAPVWCDITNQILVGGSVAIPAALLCMNRRLYQIAAVRSVRVTRTEKRRAVIEDLCIGLGIPILQMLAHMVMQGHRYDIYEDFGCYFYTYPAWPSFVLVYTWPFLISLISCGYACSSIRAFHRNRSQMREYFSSTSSVTANFYLRLMLLAGSELIITMPFALALLIIKSTSLIAPYYGWGFIHADYKRVAMFEGFVWRAISKNQASLELSRWSYVMCAIMFFAFFGFADEARKNYQAVALSIAKKFGASRSAARLFGTTGSEGEKSGTSTIGGTTTKGKQMLSPVHISQHVLKKHDHDSLASFTDLESTMRDDLSVYSEKEADEVDRSGASSMYMPELQDVGGALHQVVVVPVVDAAVAGPVSIGEKPAVLEKNGAAGDMV